MEAHKHKPIALSQLLHFEVSIQFPLNKERDAQKKLSKDSKMTCSTPASCSTCRQVRPPDRLATLSTTTRCRTCRCTATCSTHQTAGLFTRVSITQSINRVGSANLFSRLPMFGCVEECRTSATMAAASTAVAALTACLMAMLMAFRTRRGGHSARTALRHLVIHLL